jgi:hypothetical protein
MSTALRTYYRGHDLAAMVGPGTSSPRYYHFDHHGTTQALTDSVSTVTDRFASDAWGVEVKRTGSSINRQWYRANSQFAIDQNQQLCFARWTYWSPVIGRFLALTRNRRNSLKYSEVSTELIGSLAPSNSTPDCDTLKRYLDAALTWPRGSKPRCDLLHLFYFGVADYLRGFGCSFSASLFDHWLQGTGSDLKADWGHFLTDRATREKMERIREVLIWRMHFRECCGSSQREECTSKVWPKTTCLAGGIGMF